MLEYKPSQLLRIDPYLQRKSQDSASREPILDAVVEHVHSGVLLAHFDYYSHKMLLTVAIRTDVIRTLYHMKLSNRETMQCTSIGIYKYTLHQVHLENHYIYIYQ